MDKEIERAWQISDLPNQVSWLMHPITVQRRKKQGATYEDIWNNRLRKIPPQVLVSYPEAVSISYLILDFIPL